MTDTVIKLITETYAKDDSGVPRKTEAAAEVFAQKRSVTRSEFFDGGRNGLNPEYEFDVFKGDYDGQRTVEYEGKRYGVYRTFEPEDSDYIELYVERKGGTNGNGN